MWIAANDNKLRYTGRIDWSNEKEPVFVFPCTSVEMCFTGSTLRIHVRNRNVYWENYLGCILDGVQSCYYLNNNGESVIEVLVPQNETNVHQVMFFKRQDACHEMTVLGFEIGEQEKLCELSVGRIEGLRYTEIRRQLGKYQKLLTTSVGKTKASGRIFEQLVFLCVDDSEKAWSTDS